MVVKSRAGTAPALRTVQLKNLKLSNPALALTESRKLKIWALCRYYNNELQSYTSGSRS
jgi:hypothetical protein